MDLLNNRILIADSFKVFPVVRLSAAPRTNECKMNVESTKTNQINFPGSNGRQF